MKRLARKRRRSGATRHRSADSTATRRWRRGWTALLMLSLLIVTAGWFAQRLLEPDRFPLRHVHFQGELRYLDTTDLHGLAAGQLGENFFLLDLGSLRDRLLAHPWVEEVVLRRDWPDSLEVHLRERRPYAYWGEDALIDGAGRVFRPPVLPDGKGWPRLHGPRGQGAVVIAQYREFSALLTPLDLHIERLVQDQRGAWNAQLINGLALDLGRDEPDARLRRFVTLYPRVLQPRLAELAGVDLRYRNGVALRWLELPGSAETLARKRDAMVLQQARSRSAPAGRDNG